MKRLFENGTYNGQGRWIDQKAEGRYSAQYTISDADDGSKVHAVERTFFKSDGTIAYLEQSSLSFEPRERGAIWVTIRSPQGSVSGPGYAFEDQCHYELDITADNHLEFTFHSENKLVRGLGSASNKGNRTYWEETLHRV